MHVVDATPGRHQRSEAVEPLACVRRRLLRGFVRRSLLPGDDPRAMGQWAHGGAFAVDGSVRIEATDGTGASCFGVPARTADHREFPRRL